MMRSEEKKTIKLRPQVRKRQDGGKALIDLESSLLDRILKSNCSYKSFEYLKYVSRYIQNLESYLISDLSNLQSGHVLYKKLNEASFDIITFTCAFLFIVLQNTNNSYVGFSFGASWIAYGKPETRK